MDFLWKASKGSLAFFDAKHFSHGRSAAGEEAAPIIPALQKNESNPDFLRSNDAKSNDIENENLIFLYRRNSGRVAKRFNVYTPEQRKYYWTAGQQAERAFVFDILERNARVGTKDAEISALARIAKSRVPDFRDDKSSWKLGIVLMLELVLIWIIFKPVEGLLPFVFGICLQVLPVIVMCWYWSDCKETQIQNKRILIYAAWKELKRIHKLLARLLKDLEEHTTHFFHSEAIYDGYIYFILSEIYSGVEERLEILNELLNEDTAATLTYAYNALKNPLIIRCALSPAEGGFKLLPISAITPVSRALLAGLLRLVRKNRIVELSEVG